MSNSGISDKGILEIKNLKHLEVLNVYGTNITDKSIQVFKTLPSLKRLYLWGTSISKSAKKTLKEKNKDLKIIN